LKQLAYTHAVFHAPDPPPASALSVQTAFNAPRTRTGDPSAPFATTPFQVSTPHALPCTPSAAGATRVTVQWQPEGGQDVRRKEAPMP